MKHFFDGTQAVALLEAMAKDRMLTVQRADAIDILSEYTAWITNTALKDDATANIHRITLELYILRYLTQEQYENYLTHLTYSLGNTIILHIPQVIDFRTHYAQIQIDNFANITIDILPRVKPNEMLKAEWLTIAQIIEDGGWVNKKDKDFYERYKSQWGY